MAAKPERNLREIFSNGVKEAVAKAIAEHKKNGQAIVISKDGKIIKVPADEIDTEKYSNK